MFVKKGALSFSLKPIPPSVNGSDTAFAERAVTLQAAGLKGISSAAGPQDRATAHSPEREAASNVPEFTSSNPHTVTTRAH